MIKRYFSKHPLLMRFLVWVILPLTLLMWSGVVYVSKSLPNWEGVHEVSGVSANIDVYTDDQGVPHIYAESDFDAMFALGYVHAQDRFWQMEYQRRVGQGRLSEVLGKSTLGTDKLMRTLDLDSAAESSLAALDQQAKASLDAYTLGVNTWLGDVDVLPVEFQLLQYVPEKWQAKHSLLQIKMLALGLSTNFRKELDFSVLTKILGREKAHVLRRGTKVDESLTDGETLIDNIPLHLLIADSNPQLLAEDVGLGSNAWVVSGQHTSSGLPLLANDPHLNNQQPSVWYQVELKGNKLHVAGGSIPGIPAVLSGHNENIAWGITALHADVQDLFLERLHPTDDTLYESTGTWLPFIQETHDIVVRADFPQLLNPDYESVKWVVRKTGNGPLISDALGSHLAPMSLKWTALDAMDSTYSALLSLNYADNWGQFRSALGKLHSPTINFMYADREGNIGFSAAGKIPVRKSGDGSLPIPGWLESDAWTGYLSENELPHKFNPVSGVIVNANENIHEIPPHHFITTDWVPGYRAKRIKQVLNNRIQSSQKLTTEDFRAIQTDVFNSQAERILPFILAMDSQKASHLKALKVLAQWDGLSNNESIGSIIFHAWLYQFTRLIVSTHLDQDMLFMQRFNLHEQLLNRSYPRFIEFIATNANSDAARLWCDIPGTDLVESCQIRSIEALDKALGQLSTIAGSDIDNWQWSSIRKADFPHTVFANVKLLDIIFNRSTASAGDNFTVSPAWTVYSDENGFEQVMGANLRQIIDLSDWNKSLFSIDTGQSGNVLSSHYDNFIKPHQLGEMAPMTFGQSAGATCDNFSCQHFVFSRKAIND